MILLMTAAETGKKKMIYSEKAEPTEWLASIEVDTSEMSVEEVRRVLADLREAIRNNKPILLSDSEQEKENEAD